MRSLRVMVRNLSLVAVAQVLTLAASFLFTVAQARYLGPARFGELSVALSISAILTLVVDFGLSSKLPRDVAQHPEAAGKALAASFVVRVALWCAAMPLIWIGTIALGYGAELRASVLILGISVLFASLGSSLAAYFQGKEQFLFPSMGMVVQRAVAALFGVAALALGQGVVTVAVVYVVASIAQVAILVPGMRKYPVTSTSIGARAVVSMFASTATLGFFWMLGAFYYNIDLVILQRLMPAENVAWYAAAYRLFGVAISVVLFASSSVLYPVISRLTAGPPDDLRRAIERSFTYLFTIGVFVALAVAVDADQIVAFVFPARDYSPAADALRLLAPAIAAIYTNGPFFLVLLGMHAERRLLVMAAVLAVLNPLANIFAIPLYAQNASALLTTATEAIVLVWVILLTPKGLRGSANPRVVLRVFAAAIPAAVLLSLFHEVNIPFFLAAPLAGVIYVCAGIVFGVFPPDDVSAVHAVLRSARPRLSGGAVVTHGTTER